MRSPSTDLVLCPALGLALTGLVTPGWRATFTPDPWETMLRGAPLPWFSDIPPVSLAEEIYILPLAFDLIAWTLLAWAALRFTPVGGLFRHRLAAPAAWLAVLACVALFLMTAVMLPDRFYALSYPQGLRLAGR